MGLAIARTITKAHRGKIVAENRLSGGALLAINLPAMS
jgi:signal transduction histidine kinase